MLIYFSLVIISSKQVKIVTSLSLEIMQANIVTEELRDMLGSLEEGILVVKDMAIDFANEIFKEILFKAGIDSDNPDAEILDGAVFKIYRRS